MAIRLAIAFDTTPESWMAQQAQYDLWKANKKRKALEKKVKSLALLDASAHGRLSTSIR
jgi:plasmid maintenance system antidote protein VapI